LAGAGSHSDVLIIGAGSAGSVVAEQLSADPSRTVTVVEAGIGLEDPEVLAQTANGLQLPIGAASPLVQRYETVLTGRPARLAEIVRGATIGGSGAVNGGYFCRGLPRDFDGIGVPGWAWSDVLEHFRAIEKDLDFRWSAAR
jgi:choline dehydrogenase